MSVLSYLNAPLWLLGVFGSEKSPRKNPILGNPALNRWGLHRRRVSFAAAMAERRRARLARALDADSRRQFDDNGFFLTRDFLPEDLFRRLKEEVYGHPFEAREMRQGQTVTRMIPLPPSVLAAHPALAAAVRDPRAVAQLRYAASDGGQPVSFLQTIIAEPERQTEDPQTQVHADTFHPTAKAWLFLHDVGEGDGPFAYVPGSHRLTPERLDWEYRCSIAARDDSRSHHAHGSFRVRPEELEAMGLPQPQRVAVPANTLVVADTFGFHGRTPSDRATTRVELHWTMRRNPFLPWTGLDPKALPFIRERDLSLFLAYSDAREKWLKKRHIWRPVGAVRVDAPAQT
ncbi:phytanoyl-CoA dioxygenase family protein [Polymorphum gilvum]|uniref:Phytanoyl-CoA dioxygenase n=1 Tax=Polymorphum gilvum (strain LMG 25793 / CGMCC 1.9160 / SL003B-26A1) TaxID=991905 RepID=F2IV82_POLGS|nr:phytanoyl-CoA dioxygenase family protein [Polymorphum gilvum]ADZ71414.1 Phytanoyl-CoA dioxygenase [Polymorphum gilvum SL003B-26A1]